MIERVRRIVGGKGDEARRRKTAAALLILAVFALSGCNALSTAGGDSPSAVIAGSAPRDPQQDRLGAEEHPRIVAAYGGIYRDEKLEQALVRIVGKVVAASDDPGQSYRITILNAPAVNAFALPGGYLYVTRGLLSLANDSSEVAAVLAHEMGHITANHAVARQNRAKNAVIVSQVVTDVLNDDNAGRLALQSSQRSLAGFSRQQELEADAIGVKTIGRAGYDPFAAARFLSAMGKFASYKTAQGAAADKRIDFLATHPSTPERIDFAVRAARQFGAPGVGSVDADRYLDGVDGMIFGDDPTQGFVRERSFVHPGLGVGFTVPEGFVIDNTSDAVLATGTDGTALRFDAVRLTPGSDLGTYLASGWVNGLDEKSIKRFAVNGMPAATATAKAKDWAFQIAVIQTEGGATYRFIFANEVSTPVFEKAAMETVQSFRKLTASETAGLQPLRVRVVTVKAGDTDQSLARRMRGVERPLELFRALNEIEPGAPLTPGRSVKVVQE
ncbi:MAG: M48 family metalloprotease [Bauldia sp.]